MRAQRGRHGAVDWASGKPIVSVRYTLWENFDTVHSIIQDVSALARDPFSNADSYTVVNVHPWSPTPMYNVHQIVEGFPGHVEVVTLDELMTHMRNNLGAACPGDLDGSGAVDFADILAILSAWGNAGGPEDLDGSGAVDFGDILVVLATWGPCPSDGMRLR